MEVMRTFTKFALGAPVSFLGLQRSETLFLCILRAVTIALTQLLSVMSLSLIFVTSKTSSSNILGGPYQVGRPGKVASLPPSLGGPGYIGAIRTFLRQRKFTSMCFLPLVSEVSNYGVVYALLAANTIFFVL